MAGYELEEDFGGNMNDTETMLDLQKAMTDFRVRIATYPDNKEWTENELELLDEIQFAAMRLQREIERSVQVYELRQENL